MTIDDTHARCCLTMARSNVGLLDAAAAPLEATGDARITVIAGSAVARDVAATGNATITVEGQTTAPQSPAPSSPPVLS